MRVFHSCDVSFFIIILVQQSWCPPGWFRLKNRCVFMNKNPPFYYDDDQGVNMWRSARKKCNEQGADLMIARDLEDINGLFFMYYTVGSLYRRQLFLGSREGYNMRWKWLNAGGVVDSALWGPGEPDIQYGRCGVIENFEKRWFNRGCGWWLSAKACKYRRRAYICETLPGEFVRF